MTFEINNKLKKGDLVTFYELIGGDGFVGSSAWEDHKGIIINKNNELWFQNKDMSFPIRDANGEIELNIKKK